MIKMKTRSTVLSLAAGLALLAVPASAAAADGQVTKVEYLANTANPVLMIQLNNNYSTNYLAQQTSPGCNIADLSIDTIRFFHTMAQSSLLAGKNVTIYTSTCNSRLYIYDIVLKK